MHVCLDTHDVTRRSGVKIMSLPVQFLNNLSSFLLNLHQTWFNLHLFALPSVSDAIQPALYHCKKACELPDEPYDIWYRYLGSFALHRDLAHPLWFYFPFYPSLCISVYQCFIFLPLRLIPTSLLPPLLCHCCDRCYRFAWLAWNKTCQCLAEQRNDWWRQLILRSRTQKSRKRESTESSGVHVIWWYDIEKKSDVILRMYEYTSIVLWILWAKISPTTTDPLSWQRPGEATLRLWSHFSKNRRFCSSFAGALSLRVTTFDSISEQLCAP